MTGEPVYPTIHAAPGLTGPPGLGALLAELRHSFSLAGFGRRRPTPAVSSAVARRWRAGAPGRRVAPSTGTAPPIPSGSASFPEHSHGRQRQRGAGQALRARQPPPAAAHRAPALQKTRRRDALVPAGVAGRDGQTPLGRGLRLAPAVLRYFKAGPREERRQTAYRAVLRLTVPGSGFGSLNLVGRNTIVGQSKSYRPSWACHRGVCYTRWAGMALAT